MFKRALCRIKSILASSYLTVALMFYSVVLIFVATLAQVEIGVAQASKVYIFAITAWSFVWKS